MLIDLHQILTTSNGDGTFEVTNMSGWIVTRSDKPIVFDRDIGLPEHLIPENVISLRRKRIELREASVFRFSLIAMQVRHEEKIDAHHLPRRRSLRPQ